MNRAFVGENDGWRRCAEKMETCMFADENGKCVLDECRLYPSEVRGQRSEGRKE